MPSYNKPGVYSEETLMNAPATITSDSGQTSAVFIGVTDRGPTTKVGSNVVGVPTLVTSWNEFVNKFNYGSSNDVFSAVSAATTADMRYALYSFFQNNGSRAFVTRVVNTDAAAGSFSLLAQGAAATSVTTTVTASTVTGGIQINLGTAVAGITVGSIVTLSGLNASAAAANKTWVVGTATSSTQFTVTASGVSSIASTATANATAAFIFATAGAPGITISAKDVGSWSNNLFVTATSSNISGYFDLLVYYNPKSTAPSAVTDYMRVQRIPSLSLDPYDPQYAPNKVNSEWVTVTATNAAATGFTYTLMPTYYQNSDKSLTLGPVNVGTTSTAFSPSLSVVATANAGTTAPAIASIMSQIDLVNGPLVINYPNMTTAATVSSMLDYAANRGDAFVVIDPVYTNTLSTALSNASSIASGVSVASGASYGGVYYPHITIADPASKSNGTKDIPPGGAVSASFLLTDAQKGLFRAPAGTATRIRPAVSVYYSLTDADFTLNSTTVPQLNIIRYVPGAGYCIMGARTLSSSLSDVYVPVRRTLGYLRRNLADLTAQFVFERNDTLTWAQVTAVVESFLYSVWQKNGLLGASPDQAYYVKCDETTDTPTTIQNGELRIEVGVALQKPAEFIVIKLGQFQGGTSITTSV